MIFALLPAAGRSSRMGQPKLLLPYRGVTILEAVLRTLQQAGIERILVVTPPDLPELGRIAQAAGVEVHVLAELTKDMRATVEAGLRHAEATFRPQGEDDWLLIPADHPTLDLEIINQLREARESRADRSIFVPTWNGKRGHPTLIRWRHVEHIRNLPADQGINSYLRQQHGTVLEIPAQSADVLIDLDTPEDYRRLEGSYP